MHAAIPIEESNTERHLEELVCRNTPRGDPAADLRGLALCRMVSREVEVCAAWRVIGVGLRLVLLQFSFGGCVFLTCLSPQSENLGPVGEISLVKMQSPHSRHTIATQSPL